MSTHAARIARETLESWCAVTEYLEAPNEHAGVAAQDILDILLERGWVPQDKPIANLIPNATYRVQD